MFSTIAKRFSNFLSKFISKVLIALQTSVPSQFLDREPDHKNHIMLVAAHYLDIYNGRKQQIETVWHIG